MLKSIAGLALGLSMMAATAPVASAQNALTCTFSAGVVQTFENGGFKEEKVNQLTLAVGDINLERQTAALITSQGRGELKIVRAIGANHFLEVVAEGFLNMTTIYDPVDNSGVRPAVHSRHLGLLGTPVVSQYYGTCEEK